jgi:hypothetical protein
MTPASELVHLEQLLMVFPMAIRIRRRVQELRQVVAREREARLRKLRGRIRRGLSGASMDTLARVARELEDAS